MCSFAERLRSDLRQVVGVVRWSELVLLAGAPGLGLLARSAPQEGLKGLLGAGAALAVAVVPLGAHVFLVNDICDRLRDRVNPERLAGPLARGAWPVPTAWRWAVGLAGLGLVLTAALLGRAAAVVAAGIILNWDLYAWCARPRAAGGEVVASRWGKCHPLLGAGHNFLGGGLHFLLGVAAAGGAWPLRGGELFWSAYFGLLCLAGYFHHVARQEEADRASGLATVATLWGRRPALRAGAGVLVGSTALLTVGLAVEGRLAALAVPVGWLWLTAGLYLAALRRVLARPDCWEEHRRLQRLYRALYVVFGLLLAPFLWGGLD